jgi:bifunctional non-homologous end joining protein LigD
MRFADDGNIELGVTLAPAAEPDRPSWMVFGVGSAELALLLRGMFDQLGLRSLALGSGDGGVHVYVPLNSDVSFDRTAAFAKQVAEVVAARQPGPPVDWSANAPGELTICAYSLRAGKSPTVATPLTWEEVEAGDIVHDPAAVIERVAKHGDLFAPVLSLVQDLPG